MLSPIVLFVYNRLEHTKKTVEALKNNFLAKESDLFIFSDGPKDELGNLKVDNLRKYLKTVSGFKNVNIIEQNENIGLAKSIISGVTEIVNKYGKIIVLEDDLVTSPNFLTYMNEGLKMYESEDRVISIHGYSYPLKEILPDTFFLKFTSSWGWATWKRGWDLFESDGKKLLTELEHRKLIKEFNFNNSYHFSETLLRQSLGQKDSWAIRWYASAFINNKLSLYPKKSLIQNIGFDGSGIHSGKSNVYDIKELDDYISVKIIPIIEDKAVRRMIEKYFNSIKASLVKRIMWKLSAFRNKFLSLKNR